jgi:hypothetical protein
MWRKRIVTWNPGKPPALQFCFLKDVAMQESDNNPMQHPDEQPAGADGNPKFGRLLIVLAFGVLIVVGLTFGSLAYYTS